MIHSINRFITDFANLFVDGHSQHGGETMLIEEHVKKHPYVNLTDNDIEKVNLKAIQLLKEKFKMNIGYGNHAKNIFSVFVSIAYQPSDYLFYVKGNKIKKHPDEPHAIALKDLKDFIKNIKDLEKAIGNKTKIKMSANIK